MDQLSKIKICFLVSGYGSNLLKILDCLIKDQKTTFIPSIILSNNNINYDIKNKSQKINTNIKILENIKDLKKIYFQNCDLIFSIGYMKTIPKKIFNSYKTINLHPSILPHYKGLMTHKRMLLNNEKYYGFTIHIVNQFIDDGEIIFQKKLKIDTSSENILKKKHKELEYKYVYKALKKISINL